MVAYPILQASLLDELLLAERCKSAVGRAEASCTPTTTHVKSESFMPVVVEKRVQRQKM